MEISKYKESRMGQQNSSNDGDLYEQLSARPPSVSVNILRRDSRQLLNSNEILKMYLGLGLNFRHIDTHGSFKQPEAKDLCFVLKHFENAVTIGVQGA
jgi:hypothetical protein